MSTEFVFRQIALEPPSFFPLGIEYQDGRRPEDVEAVEIARIFFYVNAEGDEILVDERRQTGVTVRLGFEPRARSSIRGGAEIDQQRFVLLFCLPQRLVGVFDPVHGHRLFLHFHRSQKRRS